MLASAIPAAIMIFLAFYSDTLWSEIKDPKKFPPTSRIIQIRPKQFEWQIRYAGPDGLFNTKDDINTINDLYLPLGEPVKIELEGQDVIHSFFVPEFRVHMDVLPGRYTSVWFQATKVGTYHLFCSQYCGTNHAGMVGQVVVMEPVDYQRWLDYHAEGSLALEGRKVFLKYRCLSCHSADPNARAPVLEELFGKPVHLADGRTVIADENYIRESIYHTGAKIVAGWQNIMPTFKGQVSEEEVVALIAFIKSLKRGETPPRVEEFPPPVATPPINPQQPKP